MGPCALRLHFGDDLGPAVEQREDFVGRLRGELYDAARDALVLVAPYPVDIGLNAPDRHGAGREVAPGFSRHLMELRQEVGDVLVLRPARMRDPAVAVAE